MNNSNATKELTTVMANIQTDLKVDMKDVVDVFLSKYENSLHSERTLLQKEMGVINTDIKNLTKKIVDGAESFIKSSLVVTTNLGLVVVELKLESEPTIDWSKQQVNYQLGSSVKSVSVHEGYRCSSTGTIVGVLPVPAADQTNYHSLMDTKNGLTDKLTVVNNNLRDIGRKERQIKGLLAEKKLQEIGMEGLLNEPSLLALINDPLQA